MRNSKKALALILALVMLFSLSISASAAYSVTAETKELSEVPADLTGKTVILHSNDVHGQIDGYAYIAALRTELEGRGAEVILADAGDYSQGDPYVSLSKGASAIDMMNAAGYDVASLGNHEFDYGYAQLKENLTKATFKVICADILEGDEPILDPTFVYTTKSGVKIGFFGLDTPEVRTATNPALIKGLTILNNSNGTTGLYDCAEAQVAALKAENVDLIIGLWHLGVDDFSGTDGHRSVDVIAQVEGIDLAIDGHSHTVMTAGEDGVTVQSTGTKFENIGVVIIDDATKQIESRFLIPTEGLAKDEAVSAAAQEIMDAVNGELGAVFATSEVELNGKKAPNGNRDSETNNGNLITDAMMWSILKDTSSVTVPVENVVAITNGGGIRAAVKPGDVTKKDINTVLPFGNTVTVVYVTGAELLEALEASTFCTPTAIGGFPQTAGIKWTLDTTKAYDPNAETYPGSTYYGPASINRVTIESINGKAFDETATYAVITNNFCAAGGDTYYAFAAASSQFDTGIPLDEAVMEYVETELKGVIGAKYAEPRGDMTKWAPTTVKANEYEIELDGKKVTLYTVAILDAKGNETNYVRVRDMAALLNGSAAQFNVGWDGESVVIDKATAYTAIGGEGEQQFTGTPAYTDSPAATKIDGEVVSVTAVLLNDAQGGGYTYYQLRDLGRNLGFNVGWSAERGIYVESAVAYTDAN